MNESERLAGRVNRAIDGELFLFWLCAYVFSAFLGALLPGLIVGWVWHPAGWVVGLLTFLALLPRAVRAAARSV